MNIFIQIHVIKCFMCQNPLIALAQRWAWNEAAKKAKALAKVKSKSMDKTANAALKVQQASLSTSPAVLKPKTDSVALLNARRKLAKCSFNEESMNSCDDVSQDGEILSNPN